MRLLPGLGILPLVGLLAMSTYAQSPPLPKAPSEAPVVVTKAVNKFDIASSVKQGETLFVRIPSFPTDLSGGNAKFDLSGGSATLAGKKATIYKQEDGSYLALMSVAVDQKPGGYTLQVRNKQGHVVHETPVQVALVPYPRQNIGVSSSMASLKPEPGEMEAIGQLKHVTSGTKSWSQPFVPPTPDCMNSPFGVLRYHNGKYINDYHKGMDHLSPKGRPVKATTGGTIKIARMFRLHGGTVGIDHGQGISSVYIHLSKINVKPGQKVEKGQEVGQVGSTGFATGPHLHWGLYVNGLPVNPRQWLPTVSTCK